MDITNGTDAQGGNRKLPGEIGIWIFILGDMLIFGVFFLVFIYYRSLDLDTFSASRASLNQHYGAINTLLLLTSSWFVYSGVEAIRRENRSVASKMFSLALICGAGFCIIKLIEYTEKIKAGVNLTTNDFYMYYFVFTGIHFLHVLIGMGVLIFLWCKVRSKAPQSGMIRTFESGAAYWHMVDLLWIILFPLIYLMK